MLKNTIRAFIALPLLVFYFFATAPAQEPATKHHLVAEDTSCNCDRLALVENFLNDLETLDLKTYLSYMADDIVYMNTGLPDAVGKKAVEATLAMLPYIENFDEKIVSIHEKDGVVVAQRLETFRLKKESPVGTPGAVLSGSKVAGFFRVNRDCLIYEWQDYFDTAEYESQLGIDLTP